MPKESSAELLLHLDRNRHRLRRSYSSSDGLPDIRAELLELLDKAFLPNEKFEAFGGKKGGKEFHYLRSSADWNPCKAQVISSRIATSLINPDGGLKTPGTPEIEELVGKRH